MTVDDRFFHDECTTCGNIIQDDYHQRHNNWHNELERFMEVIKDNLPSIPRGLFNWD